LCPPPTFLLFPSFFDYFFLFPKRRKFILTFMQFLAKKLLFGHSHPATKVVTLFLVFASVWIIGEQYLFVEFGRQSIFSISNSELIKDFILMMLTATGLFFLIKYMVDERRKSELQLDMIIRGAELGIWDLNMKTWTATYNDKWTGILGYTTQELDGSRETWKKLIHPDDLNKTLSTIGKHVSGDVDMIDIEYRLRHKEGFWVWVHSRGRIMEWDGQDKPQRALGTHLDISQRKKNEEELKQLSLVASKTKNGVVITDSYAKVQWVNQAHEDNTGYMLEEIKGIYPGKYLSGQETDLPTQLRILDGLKNRTTVKEEILCYRKDGEKVWVLVEITPIFDEQGELKHFVTIENDITARKKADAQRVLLESAIQNIAEAVLIIDKGERNNPEDFKVVFSNPAFYKLSGYTASQTEGSNLTKLVKGSKSDNLKLKRILKAITNGETIEEEVVSYKIDGQPFWISLQVSPICQKHAGSSRYFVAMVKDINEAKVAHQERARLTNEVIQRNKELHEFSQIISHNLRSPVANIQGLIQIIDQKQPMGEFNERLLGHIKDAAINIDRILADLNELLTVKDSVLESKTNFSVNELVQQVLNSLQIQMEQADAETTVEILPTDLRLSSIRSYFHSIIYNLVSNALKYRHRNRLPVIKVIIYKTSSHLMLLVKDNGLGVDLKTSGDKMFKLYKRFHSHVEGKGMGLYLVKTQIERMGGSIKVWSVLDKGTAFRVAIPIDSV